MSVRESFLEIIWLIKTCLTTFWFWLPILIALYGILEIWMFIAINPLTIFILPAIMSVYAVMIEDKRTEAHYHEIGDKRLSSAIRPVGSGPEFAADWDAQERVEEYLRVLLEKKDDYKD